MKPAPFRYFRPEHLEHVYELLDHYGYDAKLLAGGQSLIPAMNMRLMAPSVLVDLARVEGLTGLDCGDGFLEIGSMVRQQSLERNPSVAERWPLLAAAVKHVGHRQTRVRGTVGGSIAHADPAAELPAVMLALGARYEIGSSAGTRWVDHETFVVAEYTTDLAENEVLLRIRVPPMDPRAGWSFLEFRRKHGAFALVGCVALLQVSEGGTIADPRIVVFGGEPRARRLEEAEALLEGQKPSEAVLREVRSAVQEAWRPDPQPLVSAAYLQHVAGVLAERACREAVARARSRP